MPVGLISGFHTYGETKEYPKILTVSLFVGLLYGVLGFIGGMLLAGTGGLTAFAIAPALEMGVVDAWAGTIPMVGIFLGLLLVGVVETHFGAFTRWFTDWALEFKLE